MDRRAILAVLQVAIDRLHLRARQARGPVAAAYTEAALEVRRVATEIVARDGGTLESMRRTDSYTSTGVTR